VDPITVTTRTLVNRLGYLVVWLLGGLAGWAGWVGWLAGRASLHQQPIKHQSTTNHKPINNQSTTNTKQSEANPKPIKLIRNTTQTQSKTIENNDKSEPQRQYSQKQ
jgi:hypothetical protein